MLFPRRTWALRVTDGMGLEPKDSRTTTISSMVIQGSKQFSKTAAGSSTAEQILMAAASLQDNQSAIERYASEQGYSEGQAVQELKGAKNAAKNLAIEHELKDLIESPWFS